MKHLTTNILAALALILGTNAFAQSSKSSLTVIKDSPMLELQAAEMTINASNGVFSDVTASSLKFSIDVKNQREVFKVSFLQAERELEMDFVVVEASVDECGTKKYIAIPIRATKNPLTLEVTDTPAECNRGTISEPVWRALIHSSLGQTNSINGELDLYGTPQVNKY